MTHMSIMGRAAAQRPVGVVQRTQHPHHCKTCCWLWYAMANGVSRKLSEDPRGSGGAQKMPTQQRAKGRWRCRGKWTRQATRAEAHSAHLITSVHHARSAVAASASGGACAGNRKDNRDHARPATVSVGKRRPERTDRVGTAPAGQAGRRPLAVRSAGGRTHQRAGQARRPQ